jgi:hypothetical protein
MPVVVRQLKKFQEIYGTWKLIAMFTEALQGVRILSQMNPVHTLTSNITYKTAHKMTVHNSVS